MMENFKWEAYKKESMRQQRIEESLDEILRILLEMQNKIINMKEGEEGRTMQSLAIADLIEEVKYCQDNI